MNDIHINNGYYRLRPATMEEIPVIWEIILQAKAQMYREGKLCDLALSRDIRSFKVDTNYDNFYMQRVFSRLGFTYCGRIRYDAGERMAYEKLL